MDELYKGEKREDLDLRKDLLYFQKGALFSLAQKFIADNEISCPETIYQCDWVIQNASEFIEEICKIVGYDDSFSNDFLDSEGKFQNQK